MSVAALKSSQNTLRTLYKGVLPYAEAYALQESLHAARLANQTPDTLLLLEHPPVFTTGRQDVTADWVLPPEEIRARGIDIIATHRGGRITYHGPGQLVGYFICDLQARKTGVADFVCAIEKGLVAVLGRYGIAAARDAEHPGVWVGEQKIAAIGLHVRRFVTLHGFALNVTTDLAPYSYCIPCGIRGRGITSLNVLQPGSKWSVRDVAHDVADYFCSMAANVGSEPSPVSSVNITHSSL